MNQGCKECGGPGLHTPSCPLKTGPWISSPVLPSERITQRRHVLITKETCPCDKTSDYPCPVCDGGLAFCSVCNKGEVELDGPCVPRIMQPVGETHDFISIASDEYCDFVFGDHTYCQQLRDAAIHQSTAQPPVTAAASGGEGETADVCQTCQGIGRIIATGKLCPSCSPTPAPKPINFIGEPADYCQRMGDCRLCPNPSGNCVCTHHAPQEICDARCENCEPACRCFKTPGHEGKCDHACQFREVEDAAPEPVEGEAHEGREILSADWLAEFEQRKTPTLSIGNTDYRDSNNAGDWIGILKTERDAICTVLRADLSRPSPCPDLPEVARERPELGAPWEAWFEQVGEHANVDVVNATTKLVIAEREIAVRDSSRLTEAERAELVEIEARINAAPANNNRESRRLLQLVRKG